MFTLAPEALISEEVLKQRISEMAVEMAEIINDRGPVIVLGMLRGSFVFMADLLRDLSREGVTVDEVDFIIASSYGANMESSGNVKIIKDVQSDISEKHVLLVDDILDTGNTLQRVVDLLKYRKPATLTTCVLLDKPSRRTKDIEADFVGFKIDDHFVVGYGLDYNQRFRELPFIGIIEERA